ncbi:hypothetical protein IT575_05665 [bacterium]|nr:hypothetical protein [bacterium]
MSRHIPPAVTIERLRQSGRNRLGSGKVGSGMLFALAGGFAFGGADYFVNGMLDSNLAMLGLGGVLLGFVFGFLLGTAVQAQWRGPCYNSIHSALTDGMLLERVLDPYAYEQLRYLGIPDNRRRRFSLVFYPWRKPGPGADNFNRRMSDLATSMRRVSEELGHSILPPGFRAQMNVLVVLPMLLATAGLLFLPGKHSREPLIHLPAELEPAGLWLFLHLLTPLGLACMGIIGAMGSVLDGYKRLTLADLLDGRDYSAGYDDMQDQLAALQGHDPGSSDGLGWG